MNAGDGQHPFVIGSIAENSMDCVRLLAGL